MPIINFSEDDLDDLVEAIEASIEEARLIGDEERVETRTELFGKALAVQERNKRRHP